MAEGGKTTAADPYPVMIPNVTIVIDQDSEVMERYENANKQFDEHLQNGGSAFEAPWIPDNLGVEGAYECTRNFSASIMANGTLAGKLTATIVDRKGPFYAACDAESSELQEISCVLFGSKGQARYPQIKEDEGLGYSCASVGDGWGFLYISEFFVHDDFSKKHALAFAMATHGRLGLTSAFNGMVPDLVERILKRNLRRSELGAAAIRALLTHEELHMRWSVAAYICDGRVGPDASRRRLEQPSTNSDSEQEETLLCNQKRLNDRKPFLGQPLTDSDREDEERLEAKSRTRRAADSRQFLRAGFKEIEYKDGGWMFMTKKMIESTPMISHSQALAIPLRLSERPVEKTKKDPQTAQDTQLFEWVRSNYIRQDRLEQQQQKFAEAQQQAAQMQQQFDQMIHILPTLDVTQQSALAATLTEKGILAAGDGIEALSARFAAQRTALDDQARQAADTSLELTRSVLVRVDELLEEGADLTRSCALHFCVAVGWGELVEELVARGADINARSAICGNTPLMLAVNIIQKMPGPEAPPEVREGQSAVYAKGIKLIGRILELGGNKDVTDESGRTALGVYYSLLRGQNDFRDTFGLQRLGRGFYPEVEGLLMPSNGPTPADIQSLEEEGEEEDSLGGLDEEEDEEDEEEED